MLARLRTRLSYANVIATIALFVALGGTGYAAAKIGSAQIKNNSVQSKDIKNNGVQGKDVKNGSLAAGDFKAGQLPAGPTGLTGPQGAAGPGGSPAASFLGGRANYLENTGESYGSPIGVSGATLAAAAADVEMGSPARTIVARDLFIRRTDAVRTPTVALRVNGVDSALQCAMDSTADLECSDTTHAVTIPAGSTLVLHESHPSSGGQPSQHPYTFGWRALTP